MGKFDGYLLVTDLDGTLLRDDKSVSEENLRAIQEFQREGGLFSFVTGRIPRGARVVVDTVGPNAPCGHGNGGCIYDHRERRLLWGRTLPPEAKDIAAHVLSQFPSLGIILCTTDDSYFHARNEATAKYCRDEGYAHVERDMATVTEPILKMMFVHADEGVLRSVMAFLEAYPPARDYSFIRSDEMYYEMLPRGACKGDLIPILAELTGVPVERIVAVGDNDNDASMLRAAGRGLAVANASEAAKAAADEITVSNREHALAAIIREWKFIAFEGSV